MVKFTGGVTGREIYLNPEHVVSVTKDLNTVNRCYIHTTSENTKGPHMVMGSPNEVVGKLLGERQ